MLFLVLLWLLSATGLYETMMIIKSIVKRFAKVTCAVAIAAAFVYVHSLSVIRGGSGISLFGVICLLID